MKTAPLLAKQVATTANAFGLVVNLSLISGTIGTLNTDLRHPTNKEAEDDQVERHGADQARDRPVPLARLSSLAGRIERYDREPHSYSFKLLDSYMSKWGSSPLISAVSKAKGKMRLARLADQTT